MADYSKQYNKITGMFPVEESEFDFEEEFELLDDGMGIAIICEGTGITQIFKTEDGVRMCVVKGKDVNYDEFMARFATEHSK